MAHLHVVQRPELCVGRTRCSLTAAVGLLHRDGSCKPRGVCVLCSLHAGSGWSGGRSGCGGTGAGCCGSGAAWSNGGSGPRPQPRGTAGCAACCGRTWRGARSIATTLPFAAFHRLSPPFTAFSPWYCRTWRGVRIVIALPFAGAVCAHCLPFFSLPFTAFHRLVVGHLPPPTTPQQPFQTTLLLAKTLRQPVTAFPPWCCAVGGGRSPWARGGPLGRRSCCGARSCSGSGTSVTRTRKSQSRFQHGVTLNSGSCSLSC